MLSVSIKESTNEKMREKMLLANAKADLIEFMFDKFPEINVDQIRSLLSECSLPKILTIRSKKQGGEYEGPKEKLLELASLQPDFLDIEYDVAIDLIQKIAEKYPKQRFIISYHNFHDTPQDLDAVFGSLPKFPNAIYKIATMTHSSNDAMRLLTFLKSRKEEMLVMGMGDHGYLTRVLGPIFGANWVYASLDESNKTAPGQVSVDVLKDIYNCGQINSSTKIYGLLCGSLESSISHLTHNAVFKKFDLNAVYVKIKIVESELKLFFKLAKELGFSGLSVTNPLKECVIPFVSTMDGKARDIGAINTLKLSLEGIWGFNTDCDGAIKALEEFTTLKNKKAVLIGAGGASKAIGYGLVHAGAQVVIVNRDGMKGDILSKQLKCHSEHIEKMADIDYDILINGTSSETPIDLEMMRENKVVMDIKTRPILTEFLKMAQKKKCMIVHGYKMFVHQAISQFRIWFGNDIDLSGAEKFLEKESLAVLESGKFW